MCSSDLTAGLRTWRRPGWATAAGGSVRGARRSSASSHSPTVARPEECYLASAFTREVFALDPELQAFSDPEEEDVHGEYVRPVPDHDLWGVLVAAGPSIATTKALIQQFSSRGR